MSLKKTKRLIIPSSVTFEEHCKINNINTKDVAGYWHKSKYFSLKVNNNNNKINQENIEEFVKKSILKLQKYSPKFKVFKRTKHKDSVCAIFPLSDLHIGKKGAISQVGYKEEYNEVIAVNRCNEGIDNLIKLSSQFKIDQIVLVLNGDIVHVDGPNNTTTNQTRQDVSMMWFDAVTTARDLIVNIIEKLLPIANIKIIHIPGNHDNVCGYMVSEMIHNYFMKNKNITFDISMSPRKAFSYGSNICFFDHGDNGKLENIPNLLAAEYPILWGNAIHRYSYQGHLHHRRTTDLHGITVRTLRSPSGSDQWHKHKTYTANIKGMECFIHDKNKGLIAEFNYIF